MITSIILLLSIILLQSSGALFAMEVEKTGTIDLEEQSQVQDANEINNFEDDETVSAFFKLYEQSEYGEAGLPEEVEKKLLGDKVEFATMLCRNRYYGSKVLSNFLIRAARLSSDFESAVMLVFLDHGADLNYALESILASDRKFAANPILKSLVSFLLSYGAKLSLEQSQLKELLSDFLSERGDALNELSALFKQYNSNMPDIETIRQEINSKIRRLFIFSVGQGQKVVTVKILRYFGHMISNEVMRETYIRAAYAGDIDMVKLLHDHNEARINDFSHGPEPDNNPWIQTLSYALQSSSLRGTTRETFRFILEKCQPNEFGYCLEQLKEYLTDLCSIAGIPEVMAARYQEILDGLDGHTAPTRELTTRAPALSVERRRGSIVNFMRTLVIKS